MGIKKGIIRVVSLLLIPCLLIGCTGYTRTVLPKGQALPLERKIVVLQSGLDRFCFYDAGIIDGSIRGTVRSLDSVPSIPKKLELRIYVDGTFIIPESLPAELSVPFTAIEKVEVYDVSTGKTIAYNVAIVGGIVGGALLASFLIWLATWEGGSCPFIYAFNGETYDFSGQTYPGAIFPPAEREDYLPLPTLKAVEGEYRLRIANELREIQSINAAELLVIDHPPGTEVLVDKYGVPHTLIDLRSPVEALTLTGEDAGDIVAAADQAPYTGDVIDEVNGDVDGLVLTFRRPRNAAAARLVLQTKDGPWLEYAYGEFCEIFGDSYGEWYAAQSEMPAEELLAWALAQGILLTAYVEKDGEWRFVDYYNLGGPFVARRHVLALDLAGVTSDEVKVKLEFGPLFWEVDYVAMDFSPDLPVEMRAIPAASAVDESGGDVAPLLRAADGLYYVQYEIGEEARLTFAAPEPAASARTVVLHSVGHYEIPRDPRGKPDLQLINSFQEPGRFIAFSKELFVEGCRTAARFRK